MNNGNVAGFVQGFLLPELHAGSMMNQVPLLLTSVALSAVTFFLGRTVGGDSSLGHAIEDGQFKYRLCVYDVTKRDRACVFIQGEKRSKATTNTPSR